MDSNSNFAHHSEGDRRSWQTPYAGSPQPNFPSNGFAHHTAPPPPSQYGPGYTPYASPPSHAAKFSQYPVGNGNGNGNGNGGPQMTFGAFNVPTWNPSTMSPGTTAPPPTMPMMDPRFLNSMMGNMPSPFPMMPFNNMAPLQGAQPLNTRVGPSGPVPSVQQPDTRKQRWPTPPVDIPAASTEYIQQASQKPQRCLSQRPLLIILDLNGTLIYRKHRKLPPSFASRAGLDHFLEVLTRKYAVMVWSSSTPATVEAVSAKLFPKDKKHGVVALWGRDRFGLTTAQYNSKLQVYKQLHKVWCSAEVQSAYPGNESLKPAPQQKKKPSGGKHSKHNQKQRQQEIPPLPVGQRWDQTNTILIDDSKLKALSEPFNILEIPEFTNDPNIDESTLFTKVLARLDTLSRHDDVSKVLFEWNESAKQQNISILELDIPSEEDIDEEEEGGISLVQPPIVAAPLPTKNAQTKKNKKGNIPQQEFQPPTDPEAIRIKKELKKARKKEKKATKKAAKEAEAAQKSNTAPTPNGATAPTNMASGGVTKAGRGKKKAKKNVKEEPDPLAQDPESIDPSAPRYTFRTREGQVSKEPQGGNGHSHSTVDNPAFPRTFDNSVDTDVPFGRRPDRSPSPVTSIASDNSLLDRLEDGLGFPR